VRLALLDCGLVDEVSSNWPSQYAKAKSPDNDGCKDVLGLDHGRCGCVQEPIPAYWAIAVGGLTPPCAVLTDSAVVVGKLNVMLPHILLPSPTLELSLGVRLLQVVQKNHKVFQDYLESCSTVVTVCLRVCGTHLHCG